MVVPWFPAYCRCGHVERGDGQPSPGHAEQRTRIANHQKHSPSILARRYAEAVHRWNAAGRPVRSDAEMSHIFETHCRPCKHFRQKKKDGIGACKLCGCYLKKRQKYAGVLSSLTNKIRMATEHCPRGYW